ncbi:hypothetical protein [Brevundimonas sp.]|uniref:hypothetical protein n=1 Tax=Brevundimonas sp. TaxID=1871086 RepID=UPI0025C3493E|nr:hypothetical protein [Brevundimonas sp.]
MRVTPVARVNAQALAVHLAQMTSRVAGHQSSPTSRPVEAPGAIVADNSTRRPSRHTFDIRV